MSYRIVVFYAAGAGRAPEQVQPMLRLIELLYQSAIRHDRDIALSVLTDRETEFTQLKVPASVERFDVNPAGLMLARTQAQAGFVADYAFEKPLIFLDLDILVNRSLAFLFDRNFDIGLTWRRKREMQINGGVILANNRNPTKVRDFFEALRAIYQTRYGHLSKWWGDQRALNELVTLPSLNARPQALSINGIDFLILPGNEFNFSPHYLWITLALPRSRKYILHFKSSRRKRFIGPYFDLHFDTQAGTRLSRLLKAYRSIA